MTEEGRQMTEEGRQMTEGSDLRFAIVDCRFYFMALHLLGVLCMYVGFGGVLFAGSKWQRFGKLDGNSSQKAIYVINPTNMC